MGIPSFCCDPSDVISPCPIMFSKNKSQVLILVTSSTTQHFLLLHFAMEFSPRDYIGKANNTIYYFLKMNLLQQDFLRASPDC